MLPPVLWDGPAQGPGPSHPLVFRPLGRFSSFFAPARSEPVPPHTAGGTFYGFGNGQAAHRLPTVRFVSFMVAFASKGFAFYISRWTVFTLMVPCLERSFLIKLINTLFYYFCSELFLLKIVTHLKSGFSSCFILLFCFFTLVWRKDLFPQTDSQLSQWSFSK